MSKNSQGKQLMLVKRNAETDALVFKFSLGSNLETLKLMKINFFVDATSRSWEGLVGC
jgi:hypothetical protein